MIKMGFYDLTKPEREKIVKETEDEILKAILDLDFKLDIIKGNLSLKPF